MVRDFGTDIGGVVFDTHMNGYLGIPGMTGIRRAHGYPGYRMGIGWASHLAWPPALAGYPPGICRYKLGLIKLGIGGYKLGMSWV